LSSRRVAACAAGQQLRSYYDPSLAKIFLDLRRAGENIEHAFDAAQRRLGDVVEALNSVMREQRPLRRDHIRHLAASDRSQAWPVVIESGLVQGDPIATEI
jgi:hypothetical protein